MNRFLYKVNCIQHSQRLGYFGNNLEVLFPVFLSNRPVWIYYLLCSRFCTYNHGYNDEKDASVSKRRQIHTLLNALLCVEWNEQSDLVQRLANCPPPVFVNKMLLVNRHTHVYLLCMATFVLQWQSCYKRPCLQSPKYLLPGSLYKKSDHPCLRKTKSVWRKIKKHQRDGK